MSPRIVAHAPSPSGGRRVTDEGRMPGLAHGERDVVGFVRRTGLDEDSSRLDEADVIE